jgi:PPOX class probable F420-dependent enzyme
MATELSWSDALDWAFARPRTATLATTLADGSPHAAPVWVARDGDRIVFNTGAGIAKGRALQRDPRVAISFDDEAPPFAFVTIRGTVELDEDPERVLRWATVIGGRYMGAEHAEAYGRRNGVPGELLVVVTPTRVIGALDIAE